jgi:hypothetical protein
VIVSYVELKKGAEDAFLSEAFDPQNEKAADPFVHGTAAWLLVGLLVIELAGNGRSA